MNSPSQSLLYPDYIVQASIDEVEKDDQLLQELLDFTPEIYLKTHHINTETIPQPYYPFPSFDNPPIHWIPDNVRIYMQQQQPPVMIQPIEQKPVMTQLIEQKPIIKIKKKKRPYQRFPSKTRISYHAFLHTLFQACTNPTYKDFIKLNDTGGFTILDIRFFKVYLCKKIWKIQTSHFYKILKLNSFHEMTRKSNQIVYYHPSFKHELLHSLTPHEFKTFF
jgi:hypothetical protein